MLTNVTAMDKRGLEIKVGISYHSDTLKAKDILRRLVEKMHKTVERRIIFVDQLADSAVILEFGHGFQTDSTGIQNGE